MSPKLRCWGREGYGEEKRPAVTSRTIQGVPRRRRDDPGVERSQRAEGSRQDKARGPAAQVFAVSLVGPGVWRPPPLEPAGAPFA